MKEQLLPSVNQHLEQSGPTVTTGGWLMVIAVIHNTMGLFFGSEPLTEIWLEGGFGTVTDDQPWRMAIFWFMGFGLLLFLIGATWHWIERQGLRLPRSAAVGLVLTSLFGIFFIPVSGFWLVLAVAAQLWYRTGIEKP